MKYITVCGNDNTEDVDVFDTAWWQCRTKKE